MYLFYFRRISLGCLVSKTSASCWPRPFTHLPMGTKPFQAEWSRTQRQAERTQQPGWLQQQRSGTGAFRFASRIMRRAARIRTSASLKRDEHATALCTSMMGEREMRLQPIHYLPRLLRHSTPQEPKYSSSTCGTMLFKAATIPPLDTDLNSNYSIQNKKIFTSQIWDHFEII